MEEVSKPAVVTAIKGTKVTLKITSCSMCSECGAKNFCSMSENQEKEVVVDTQDATEFRIGEKVSVSLSSGQGVRAVVYGYVLPLVLLLAVVIGTSVAGYDDFISGISGIIVLIPYYFGLFLLKDKLKSDFQFKITKKD